MAHAKNHDYHILKPSIWPFTGAVSAFIMLFGMVLYMHFGTLWLVLIGLAGVLYTMYAWWSEVVHEANTGDHTPVVRHRPALRLHPVHHVGSDVLLGLVLDLLQARDVPRRAALPDPGRGLAAEGDHPSRSLAPADHQHADPAVLGRGRHLGAPRAGA